MPKRRLKDIADELGISFDEAKERVFKHLDEGMISGKGKAVWVSEEGQLLLDDFTPMPIIYRGPFVKVRELGKKVPVKIPAKLSKLLTVGKMVYLQCTTDCSTDEQSFKYIKAPKV
jgi:DNA-binding Lrp family transcriptional regulator